jgi:quercetin dioxygenase-like cupin family protein
MKLKALCVGIVLSAVSAVAQHAGMVEMKDIKPAMKFEQPVQGFLTPLNDKLKMRATEVEFAPGGSVGDHFHVGPGIRYVVTGEVTITEDSGAEKVVKQGEYFYESGDKSVKAANKGTAPAKLLVVELLPGDWSGSAMLPVDRRNDLQQQGQKLQKSVCGK